MRILGAITRALRRDPMLMMGVAILAVLTLSAVFATQIASHDPMVQTLDQRLLPPAWDAAGEPAHLLGTDSLGRDVLSRLLHGARYSLAIAGAAVVLSAALGVALATVAGYRGGLAEHLIMRVVDAQLALSAVLFAIMVNAIFGISVPNLILVLALTGWANYTRILFGLVRGLRAQEFVTAAVAIGCRPSRVVLRHVMPNIVSALVVVVTLQLARMMLLESGLSYLGLGVPEPLPAWGNMLAAGQRQIFTASYLTTIPGLALTLTVWGVSLVGDGLRRALDPRVQSFT